jgi:hypothetical protein
VLFISEGRLRRDCSTSELTRDGRSMDEHFRELTVGAA